MDPDKGGCLLTEPAADQLQLLKYDKNGEDYMIKYFLIAVLIGFTIRLSAKELTVKFYSDELHLEFSDEIYVSHTFKPNKKNLMVYYEKLDKTPYQGFLNQLKKY